MGTKRGCIARCSNVRAARDGSVTVQGAYSGFCFKGGGGSVAMSRCELATGGSGGNENCG